MINLFETFDQPSVDLLRSQMIAKIKVPSVVMIDNGFLPDDVDSPVKYYCKMGGNRKPLYFDQLEVPTYCKIKGSAAGATVYDLDQKRANVIFSAQNNSRFIQKVQWLNKAGVVAWEDHYDNHGQQFAKTIYSDGHAVERKFFNRQHQLVISWNLQADDVFLFADHQQRHFASWIEFVCFYLEQRHYNLDHILINTLNKSLAVLLNLKTAGEDTIFWHEKITNGLPGNMKFVMDNPTRVKHIICQVYNDWQKRAEWLPEDTGNVDFRYLGMIYPHPRSNQLRPNALILTNSDQIEHLDELVKALPQVHFNIAAVTEMSGKLLAFQDYQNVDTYPTVSAKRISQLITDCDIYFDINYQNEILDAVRGAFEQNMLILGFKNTLHQPSLVADANVFDPNDVQGMANQVLSALVQPERMKDLIDQQRLSGSDVSIEDYQEVFEALQNEK